MAEEQGSGSGGGEPPEFSVFVGDLAYDVDHALLDATFKSQFSSCTSAMVMMDPVTGRSRGFGFVRFSDEAERDRAITEMNGVFVGSKPVRVSLATARPNPTARSTASGGTGPSPGELDPNNTTLFVGGLSPAVSEPELHAAFAAFGDIVYTKIPAGKGCGFVQFVQRPAAELAMERMQGCMMSNMPIRVSWGKSSRPPPTSAMVGSAVAAQQQQQQQQHQGLPATMIAGGVYGGGAYGSPYGAAAAGYLGTLQGYGAAGGVGNPYGLPYGATAFDAAAAYGAQMGYMAFPGAGSLQDAYAGFGYHAASQAQGAGSSAASPGATTRSAAAGATTGAPGAAAGAPGRAGGGGGYDPLAAMSNMAKLNAALMQQQHRHLPMMAGHHYVRVPVAMPVQHM